ncbi:Bug family tripartite tricarboxylate transporter substrate binding protein [Cupriavidus gilardii]|uniref:Bug family tripartite tricarboxylate transporter substrate binding protein n=1 Tax=Cupriavidus gilardii TaxID=82541 RepID=UPI001573CA93|nr:tripartite tricarboxylate transporter substrate binding protein [Cupriavidus gilardii]NSX04690.1 tripartite tricarboxylate transporter substrate binding protein [Cupriavidus gilardii]
MIHAIRKLAGHVALLATAALTVAAPAALAAYPERPIAITVPTAPGGTVDIVARIMAEQLGGTLGQPLVVNNKAGAGGVVGTQAARREAADGYNLLFTANSNQLIVPWVYKKPGFDPIKDFVPIAAVGVVPNVLCVHPSFPARDLKGFLAEVKANPDKYRYASAGSGTLNHLLGEMMNEKGGLKMQHIPYKGVAPAMTDVMGNQVPMLFASLPSAVEAVKAGKLRAIGVSSATRAPLLPDVPAIAEQIPGFSGDLWVAFYAPRGTPQPVVDKLHAAIKSALASPALQQRFQQLGVTVLRDGPEQLAARQQKEFAQWKQIVERSGAAVD